MLRTVKHGGASPDYGRFAAWNAASSAEHGSASVREDRAASQRPRAIARSLSACARAAAGVSGGLAVNVPQMAGNFEAPAVFASAHAFAMSTLALRSLSKRSAEIPNAAIPTMKSV
jgi:hypothetical protein